MLSFLVVILCLTAGTVQGGGGCKEIKREFPELHITRKPLSTSNGTCALPKTCCREEVEGAVKEATLGELRHVVQKEVKGVRGTLRTIQEMTRVQMLGMVEELVPGDVAALLDARQIGEVLWQYTLGNITAYQLTVEVAVIGSGVLFTDRAAQDLLDMTECIIRELGKHATQAFQQIAAIVENVLEAPRTFGMGFEVVEILLDSMEHFSVPADCTYGQLVGCPRCGIRTPPACRGACAAAATHCLQDVYQMKPLWDSWVQSVTSLVDAMVLMKDVQINPNDLVTPELVEELTNDIMSSMVNVDFKQCKAPRSKRAVLESVPPHTAVRQERLVVARHRRTFSEGQIIETLLVNYFTEAMTSKACKASTTDTKCWLGHRIGNYDDVAEQAARATKTRSYAQDTGRASIAVHNYKDLVENVISNIYAKVRAQRDSPPVPAGYTMFSSSCTSLYTCTLLFLAALLSFLLGPSTR